MILVHPEGTILLPGFSVNPKHAHSPVLFCCFSSLGKEQDNSTLSLFATFRESQSIQENQLLNVTVRALCHHSYHVTVFCRGALRVLLRELLLISLHQHCRMQMNFCNIKAMRFCSRARVESILLRAHLVLISPPSSFLQQRAVFWISTGSS